MPKKQQPPLPQRQQFLDALKGVQKQQPQQQQNQNQNQQQQTGQQRQDPQQRKRQAPPDWLVPKVYKGSTNI